MKIDQLNLDLLDFELLLKFFKLNIVDLFLQKLSKKIKLTEIKMCTKQY